MAQEKRIKGITSQQKIYDVVEKISSQIEDALGKMTISSREALLGESHRRFDRHSTGKKVDMIARDFELRRPVD